MLTVVEIFRSERNRHAFRLNGDYPSAPGHEISTVRLDPVIPRLVIVESPAGLESPDDGQLLIDFEGATTKWTKVAASDKVWLSPIRSNPLEPGLRYALIKGEDGRLKLERFR